MEPIKLEYDEPSVGAKHSTGVNLEDIIGSITRVSSVPAWTPKLYKDNFAIYVNGATKRLYVYDTVLNTWSYTALT